MVVKIENDGIPGIRNSNTAVTMRNACDTPLFAVIAALGIANATKYCACLTMCPSGRRTSQTTKYMSPVWPTTIDKAVWHAESLATYSRWPTQTCLTCRLLEHEHPAMPNQCAQGVQ